MDLLFEVVGEAVFGALQAVAGILHPTLNPKIASLQRRAGACLGLALAFVSAGWIALFWAQSIVNGLLLLFVGGAGMFAAGFFGHRAEREFKLARGLVTLKRNDADPPGVRFQLESPNKPPAPQGGAGGVE